MSPLEIKVGLNLLGKEPCPTKMLAESKEYMLCIMEKGDYVFEM